MAFLFIAALYVVLGVQLWDLQIAKGAYNIVYSI